jgi:hypothetical protein
MTSLTSEDIIVATLVTKASESPRRMVRLGVEALTAAGLVLAGCGVLPDVGTTGATAKTAPPHPATIPGYRANSPIRLTIRTFEGGSPIPGMQVTMNHCDLTIRTIRWRSLGGSSVVKVLFNGTNNLISQQTDEAGLLTLNQCQNPVFVSTVHTVVDVTIEYINWDAAP